MKSSTGHDAQKLQAQTRDKYSDLNTFLAKHSSKNCSDKDKTITHTRIPDQTQNIFPGAYIIPKEELPTFYSLYYTHIFEHKKKEYLTERQLEYGGAMALDFDFRYNHSVTERQHTSSHVIDILVLYLEELKEFFVFEENRPFHVYVFEKPHVNRLADGSLTKDGIHIIIAIQVDHVIQSMIRDKILKTLAESIDLPLINPWDSVLDKGITEGTTNWQLFGSRKPGNEAYEFTQHYEACYVADEDSFNFDEKKVCDFNLKRDFPKLSIQYTEHPKFEMQPAIQEQYAKMVESKKARKKASASKIRIRRIAEEGEDEDENDEEYISPSSITDMDSLNRAIDIMHKRLGVDEYELKDIHEYVNILPPSYYEPGSHVLNRKVAFALKHTDERLFYTWIWLRAKASDFDYAEIPALYAEWKKFTRSNANGHSVTKQSIKYWARKENPEAYEQIKLKSCDHFIQEAVNTNAESDYARILKQMFGDTYKCTGLVNRGTWYRFVNHRWVLDKRNSLREKISTDLYNLFGATAEKYETEAGEYIDGDDRKKYLTDVVRTIQTIKINLKKTTFKDHIMREAAEQMYDEDFIRCADTDTMLIGFNNGVVDFKQKVFREGYPEDYITKSTRIDYVPPNESDPAWVESRNVLMNFMKTLFPIEDMCRYMFDHLSSTMIGVNMNQTFHIYHGSGSNGKSLMVDLMGHTLGDYKATVPITLVTDARGKIGGTSDEVLKLKGARYAVMQEPQKSVKLNEGVMKELTGNDPIQARGLYMESEIFMPQFKLAVGTNSMFDIDTTDDGTWRRIRKCSFISKFVDDGEPFEDDTKYVFKKDKTLNEKLRVLAPVFAGMLVQRAYETMGIVEECDFVMEASKKYRNGQDQISAFINDKIRRTSTFDSKVGIKRTSILEEFKLWFQTEHGNKGNQPKSADIYEMIVKRFKIQDPNKKIWAGLEFIRDDEEEDAVEQL